MEPVETSRRAIIAAGLGAVLAAAPGDAQAAQDKIEPEKGVTAPEDLMKEHGVLNRCLLIYEEGIRRLRAKEEVRPEVFHRLLGVPGPIVHPTSPLL